MIIPIFYIFNKIYILHSDLVCLIQLILFLGEQLFCVIVIKLSLNKYWLNSSDIIWVWFLLVNQKFLNRISVQNQKFVFLCYEFTKVIRGVSSCGAYAPDETQNNIFLPLLEKVLKGNIGGRRQNISHQLFDYTIPNRCEFTALEHKFNRWFCTQTGLKR